MTIDSTVQPTESEIIRADLNREIVRYLGSVLSYFAAGLMVALIIQKGQAWSHGIYAMAFVVTLLFPTVACRMRI